MFLFLIVTLQNRFWTKVVFGQNTLNTCITPTLTFYTNLSGKNIRLIKNSSNKIDEVLAWGRKFCPTNFMLKLKLSKHFISFRWILWNFQRRTLCVSNLLWWSNTYRVHLERHTQILLVPNKNRRSGLCGGYELGAV